MSVKPLIMMTIAGLLAPILFGCGGGGDDGVSGPAFGTYARGNPTAEDLLDHWDDPERLRSALGLSAVATIAESRAAIRALLEEGAGGATIGTRAMLRNVQPEDIVVVGERDGITYGQWKGGPAGTLNIEFDWRFAENVDAESRVRMERAGKLWSRRVEAGDEAILHASVHERTEGVPFRPGDVRPHPPRSSEPFVVDRIRPAGAKQFRDRKLEQQVPERRRIEHIGVKQRRDRHPAAYSYPMPSAWLSSTSRSRAFSRSRLDRSS